MQKKKKKKRTSGKQQKKHHRDTHSLREKEFRQYMLPIIFNNGSDEMTSATTSMDISESFRPEDLSKTDFFDFVSAPPPEQQESNQGTQSGNNVNSSSNNDQQQQPLQGFDQVSQ